MEIFTNASGYHFALRELHTRVETIIAATRKCGGVYMYSNLLGCDGGRLYFDGCCIITVNGDPVAQGPQFTLKEVDITLATVDLDDVTSYRSGIGNRGPQVERGGRYPRIDILLSICHSLCPVSSCVRIHYYMPEEEVMLGIVV